MIYSGDWNVSNGTLNCQNADNWNAGVVSTFARYKNFEMSFKTKMTGSDYAWVAAELRKSSPQDTHETSGYTVMISPAGSVGIYKGGDRKIIKSGSATGIQTGSTIDVRIMVKDNKIMVYLNNQLTVEATDDTFKEGAVSLNSGAINCSFDDLTIKPLA